MKKNVFFAVALLALAAVGAFAQTYTAESNFQVTRSGNAITITRYVGAGDPPPAVNIPPTIQNTPVTTIGGGIFTTGMAGHVTSLTIPASVTSIQATAFYNLLNLRSVTFLGTIPRAGFAERAFNDDLFYKFYATDRNNGTPGTYTKSGTTWTLTPAATSSAAETSADNFDYSTTSDRRGIVINEYRGTATTVRIPDRITNLPVVEIGNDAFNAFNGGTRITSVVIPNTVTTIGNNAFRGQEFTSVTLPTSLISIGSYAFSDCTELTSITIPSRVTTIGANAFSTCSSLTSVTLPASITTIGNRAFVNCGALTTVTIPASVTRITFAGTNANFANTPALNAASKSALQRVGYTGTF